MRIFLGMAKETKIEATIKKLGFVVVGGNMLIKESKKDFWKIFENKTGEVYIERLVDQDIVKDAD